VQSWSASVEMDGHGVLYTLVHAIDAGLKAGMQGAVGEADHQPGRGWHGTLGTEEKAEEPERRLGGRKRRADQEPMGRTTNHPPGDGWTTRTIDDRVDEGSQHAWHGVDRPRLVIREVNSAILASCANLEHIRDLSLCQGFSGRDEVSATEQDIMHLVGKLPGLKTLNIAHCPFPIDNLLDEVGKANRIAVLRLDGTRWLGDGGIRAIARMSSLRTVSASGTRMTEREMAELADSQSLRSLRVNGRLGLDKTMEILVEKATLRKLYMSGNGDMTPNGMQHLANLSTLETLSLQASGCTDAKVRALCASKSLVNLEIMNCKELTEEGIELISCMPQLQSLKLPNCEAVDGCLFSGMATQRQNLRKLNLDDSLVSDKAIQTIAGGTSISWLSIRRCVNLSGESTQAISRMFQLEHLRVGGGGWITEENIKELVEEHAALRTVEVIPDKRISTKFAKAVRLRMRSRSRNGIETKGSTVIVIVDRRRRKMSSTVHSQPAMGWMDVSRCRNESVLGGSSPQGTCAISGL
jgi:hypothetical protein